MASDRASEYGDWAWCDEEMWQRFDQFWFDRFQDVHRTDAEMTAAGAVLVATTDGPVSQHLQAELDTRTADYNDLRDNHLIPALNELDETRAALDRARDLATEWAALAPSDDWGNDMASTVQADLGRTLLSELAGRDRGQG